MINPKINGIATIKREKYFEKLELKYSVDSSFDLIWQLNFSSLFFKIFPIKTNKRTKSRSTKDRMIAKDLLSRENQYLKIPTEKVLIQK